MSALKFPIELQKGKPVFVPYEESIKQSIIYILSTNIGTTFFKREYGSPIEELLFENNDDIVKGLLNHYIHSSLSKWEDRIQVEDIFFTTTDTSITASIRYKIKNTTNRQTLDFSLTQNN